MAEHSISVKGRVIIETRRLYSLYDYVPFKLIEKHLTKVYCKTQNKMAEAFNKRIDKWNKEFEKLHPDKDGWSLEYNVFICQKANRLFRHLDPLFGPIARYELDSEGLAYMYVEYLGYKMHFICDEIGDEII